MLVPQGSWYVGRVGEILDTDNNGNFYVRWERKKNESKVTKKEWVKEFFLINVAG